MAKKFFSPFYCLGCIDNRIGCLIIAFVEGCWFLTNFALCTRALRKAVQDYIMRLDYYRDERTDTYTMILAGLGLFACLSSVFFTMALVLVAVRRGKMKYLLPLYIVKNLSVVICEIIVLHLIWFSKKKDVWGRTVKRKSIAVTATVSFGILFQLYACYIVIIYYFELMKKEEIAKKLQNAYNQVQNKGNKKKKIAEQRKKDKKGKKGRFARRRN